MMPLTPFTLPVKVTCPVAPSALPTRNPVELRTLPITSRGIGPPGAPLLLMRTEPPASPENVTPVLTPTKLPPVIDRLPFESVTIGAFPVFAPPIQSGPRKYAPVCDWLSGFLPIHAARFAVLSAGLFGSAPGQISMYPDISVSPLAGCRFFRRLDDQIG